MHAVPLMLIVHGPRRHHTRGPGTRWGRVLPLIAGRTHGAHSHWPFDRWPPVRHALLGRQMDGQVRVKSWRAVEADKYSHDGHSL